MDLFFNWTKLDDPRTANSVTIKSPIPYWIIIITYLVFTLVFGPMYMKNRQPFNLKKTIIIYNLTQIVFNAIMLCLTLVALPHYSLFCNEIVQSYEFPHNFEVMVGYMYGFNKYMDLLDTVFFVLRKKFNQITFLHVFHHVVMALGAYYAVKGVPGGQTYILVLINVTVHTVMYYYYLQTIISQKTTLWWKQYITLLQMIQFAIGFVLYFGNYLHPTCKYDKSFALLASTVFLIFAYMFGSFYHVQYVKKKPAAKCD